MRLYDETIQNQTRDCAGRSSVKIRRHRINGLLELSMHTTNAILNKAIGPSFKFAIQLQMLKKKKWMDFMQVSRIKTDNTSK